MLNACLLPTAISDLFAQVSSSGYITKADQYGLKTACLSETLSDEERAAIDRLLRAVQKKRVAVVQELSVVE